MVPRAYAYGNFSAGRHARAAARALITLLVVTALFVMAHLAAPSRADAATSFERQLMSIDRSDLSLSNAHWDELQETLRQTRSYSAATFSTDAEVVDSATNSGFNLCGSSAASGDVNGDGRADVVIGCKWDSRVAHNAGNALVFTRNAANNGFDPAVMLTHPTAAADHACGSSVAVGDVNGDFRSDVVMGCPGDSAGASAAGSMVVFFRNAGNTGFNAGVVLTNPTPVASDFCGEGVAAGDVNGDGRADPAMGCWGDDTAAAGAGNMVVFTRNAGNNGFDPAVELAAAGPGGACGESVASGDVNGDGRADVMMGCNSYDVGAVNMAGGMVVFVRNVGNTGFNPGVILANPTPVDSDECGGVNGIASGDVNGDGRADALMGCGFDSTTFPSEGNMIVFTRNAGNNGFNAGVELANPSPNSYEYCGAGVTTGDVNGDGRADAIMGCYEDDGGAPSAGEVVVFTRNVANTGFDPAVEIANPSPNNGDYCGETVTSADVNGDARADVVMGCPWDDTSNLNAGSAIVFTRNGANTGFTAGVILAGPTIGLDDLCAAATGSSDVNGDGRADLLVGCPYDDAGAVDAGSVVVLTRNASNSGFGGATILANPTAGADDRCGSTVASGDLNGDGLPDVLVGCHHDDGGATDAGSVIVFTRNATNTGFDAGVELANPSPVASDLCGSSVAVGDVNGDGRSDLLVGCPQDNTGAADAGNTVVFTRNSANTGFDAGIELANPSPVASDLCGSSTASGDVNGDGRADVLVGCTQDDTGASAAGNMIVFTRNATNTGFDAGVELANPTPGIGDICGTAIAVGDVNDDGYTDASMGCPQDDMGAADAGSVVVFTRNVGNTGFNAAVVLANPTPVAGDLCGTSLAAGDVNGDAHDDAIMGCSQDDTGASGAGNTVVFTRNGANNGFDAAVEIANPTPLAGDSCGTSMAAGDINGDGLSDPITGCAYGHSTFQEQGTVVVTAAAATGSAGSGELTELANSTPVANDQCGVSVASGDVNGDGRADEVMGCVGDDTGASAAGNVIVFTRNAGNTGFTAGVELANPTPVASDQCGGSVATGDVNADGRTDVVMGCQGDDTGAGGAGNMIVFTRNAGNNGFDPAVELAHPTPVGLEKCGISVAVGDVNGDGRGDPVMGCSGDSTGAAGAGNMIVFTRNAGNNGFDAAVELMNPSPVASDQCGISVAVGDVNGDGRGDPVMGCSGDSTGVAGAGNMIVFTRNAGNNGFDAAVELMNPTPIVSDQCGLSIAVGDFNGDGRRDAIMGCQGDDTGQTGAGNAIVFTRNVANTGFDAAVELVNPNPMLSGRCGVSVATGDVNGDGRADAIVGCNQNNNGASTAGDMIEFPRNAANTGFDTGAEMPNPTPVSSDKCGTWVASGDVNGDGRADAVMGCTGDDTGALTAGNMIMFSGGGSAVLRTRRLNLQSGLITDVTVSLVRVANGALQPTLEASANGGTTWESVTAGVSHSFGTTGMDLRLRLQLPDTPNPKMTQLVHDLTINYTYVPDTAPNTPSNTNPGAGSASNDTTPTLTSSAFSDPDVGNTHGASQWQVRTSAGTYAAPAWDSGTDATNLTSITTSALAQGTYFFHVRHRDNIGAWSAYSTETNFTVDSTPPPAVTPLNGASPTNDPPALTWTTVVDTGGGTTSYYRVYRSPAGCASFVQISTNGSPTTGAYTDATAATGNTYCYKVQAVDTAGNEQTIGNATRTIVYDALVLSTSCTGTAVNFGAMVPGTGYKTSTDCNMTFGASGNTSMLKLYQQDGAGTAMTSGANTIPQYLAGTNDFTQPNAGLFAACLSSVTNATAVWTVNLGCTTTDGAWWNPVQPLATDTGTKFVQAATGVTNAQANLRFGMRYPTTQPPGAYTAPLVIEVIAPAV